MALETNQATHVLDVGNQLPAHNRELTTVLNSASQSVTWKEGFGPKEIEIFVSSGDGFVCFDAPNNGVAAVWLADAGSSSTDSMRHYIADETIKPTGNTYRFSGELRRLDVIGSTGTIANVYVGAK